jgi:uncharacterized spore protein YtfJ/Tfp pilus assembly protein PilF
MVGRIPAQEKSPIDSSLQSFDRMLSRLNMDSIMGKPIKSGNTVIIPFARIKFGLGGGGAASAFGGGMGGKVIPVGLLIIEGETVKIEMFPIEEKKPSFLQELLPMLLKMLPELLGDKFPFPTGPSSDAPKPEIAPEHRGKESLDLAKQLFDEENYPEALAVVDSLIAQDSKNPDLHAWRGLIMGSMATGNPANMMKYGLGAMQAFEKALNIDPNNVTARFGRGIARTMAPEGLGKNLDSAIEDLEFACKKDPFPEAYYFLGIAYKEKGWTDKAKTVFKKALEINPDYADAAKALAEIK